MRLTDVETIRLRVSPKTTYVFLKLSADDGSVGLGDGSSSGGDAELASLAARLFEGQLAGRAVSEIGSLIDGLLAQAPAGVVPLTLATAISALEQALWDLRGRQLGVPIHALLGGRRRSRIPLYANINRGLIDRSSVAFAERAAAAVVAGFRAVKCAPFDGVSPARIASGEAADDIGSGIRRIEAVRAAIGPEVGLMVDCHERFDPPSAIATARLLEPTALRWFEEPVPMYPPEVLGPTLRKGVFEDLAQVAAAIPFPFTAGEKLFGVGHFACLFRTPGVAYTMPDVKHCGGIWELMRIGALAEAAGIGFSPHNPGSAVMGLASAQVAAALPSFDLLEYQWGELDWRSELIEPAERVEDGAMLVPDRPGLGASLNERLVERYRASFDD